MVATKVGKKVGTKLLRKVGKSSTARKAGAGAAAAATAEFLEDNPYVSAAEGAALGFAVAGPIGAAAGGLIGWFMVRALRLATLWRFLPTRWHSFVKGWLHRFKSSSKKGN